MFRDYVRPRSYTEEGGAVFARVQPRLEGAVLDVVADHRFVTFRKIDAASCKASETGEINQ